MVFLAQNFHIKIKFKAWNLFWRRTHKVNNIIFIAAKCGTTFWIAIIFVYTHKASTKIKMFSNGKRKLDRQLKKGKKNTITEEKQRLVSCLKENKDFFEKWILKY